MDNIIEIKNLSKSYGSVKALDDLSLNIKKGRVLGLLGPNGSGKSTLLKIIAGLIKRDIGEVLIKGEEINIKSKKIVSYLPDSHFLFDNLTIFDMINFYNDMYDDFDKDKAYKLLDYLKLSKDMKPRDLSKGLYERLAIILILSRDAEIYLLDEPIDGVDQVTSSQIINIILNTISPDKTFIIATHEIKDFEDVFDDLIFLNNGEIYIKDSAEKIIDKNNMGISDYYNEIYFG